ncbi:hypothetical protein JHK82_042996 [Glycine max]|nr:hypothetical protein JHK82_042996 [Glycine max]
MAAMISGFCHDVFNELPDEFGSENLCVLEETFVDSEALRLEKAIILQLGKVLAELEKIRTAIEEDTKPVASLSTWADASEVHEKVLQ